MFKPATPYYGRLEQLASDIRRYQGESRAVVAVTQHARRLVEILEQENIGVTVSDGMDQPPQSGRAYVVAGSLREGWTLESLPSIISRHGRREELVSHPLDRWRAVRHGQGTPLPQAQA